VLRRFVITASSSLLILAGCANKYASVTPELQASFMSDLKAGKNNLDCGAGCSFTWLAQAPSIHSLDLAEKWPDLAVRVMQIGYGSDLAYYYLGQSAQGLGYHQAAIGYYSTSLALATGPNPLLKCSAGQGASSDPCQGVDLISSIPVLIQASRDAIAQQVAAQDTPAPVKHHHHHTQPASSTAGWTAPPPPSSGSGSSTASGWTAPPPASP
jgi:hypothetical protein